MSAGTEGAAIAGLYLATALISRLRFKGILDEEDAKVIIDSVMEPLLHVKAEEPTDPFEMARQLLELFKQGQMPTITH
jgi:hypothetical protein